MNKCVLILPYFGKFNNYFPLFLRSCGANPTYDYLIFTDNTDCYMYPNNVHIMPMTLDEFRANAAIKLGFVPCIPSPYKLCDFKPAYGLLFEEYIKGYEYWGHCDCDLIFGNLEKMLTPILKEDYDKIFSAGHLTLYRNTPNNNRRFMKSLDGREIYREALTTNRIYVFDEDNPDSVKNPDLYNVHSIFLQDKAKVFTQDLSMNVSILCDRITRSQYDPQVRTFVRHYTLARYYWDNGRVISVSWDSEAKEIHVEEFLYMHFMSRKLRMPLSVLSSNTIEILPDRFAKASYIPDSLSSLRLPLLRCPSRFYLDIYSKKIRGKLKRKLKN
ncbi:DUF6625 family protein [Bifidobacterium oedipodis]|uniref:Uncharacterized protein n=1 Tax=Bifidobacterium oedipodis TaxID=2675322 RepID=A0A7Y0ERR0_9BIFI|nr:DUF6625 family protein [Bifidobacterium sp. DSM 109957]NMM95228.1 hypothetical protein [Bifidobacterium sp. DSM 109957]